MMGQNGENGGAGAVNEPSGATPSSPKTSPQSLNQFIIGTTDILSVSRFERTATCITHLNLKFPSEISIIYQNSLGSLKLFLNSLRGGTRVRPGGEAKTRSEASCHAIKGYLTRSFASRF